MRGTPILSQSEQLKRYHAAKALLLYLDKSIAAQNLRPPSLVESPFKDHPESLYAYVARYAAKSCSPLDKHAKALLHVAVGATRGAT